MTVYRVEPDACKAMPAKVKFTYSLEEAGINPHRPFKVGNSFIVNENLAGSKGPDQYWSIPYLLPFSRAWDFVWTGQWPLNSWQNFAVTAMAIIYAGYMAWKRGISPVEIFSCRANQAIVDTLRYRFAIRLQSQERQ